MRIRRERGDTLSDASDASDESAESGTQWVVEAPVRARSRGWLTIALGVAALGAAAYFAWDRTPQRADPIALTAGSDGTTRALVAHALAREVSKRGVECTVVATEGAASEIESARSGAADFALVSGVFRIPPETRVLPVAPLQIEALHLLVKEEIAPEVDESLAGLRGRTVDLGPRGSATAGLAGEVLAFSDVRPAGASGDAAGYTQHNLETDALLDLVERGDRAALPDAIFHLGTLPSIVAFDLVRRADYRLVALPFAESLRLASVLASDADKARSGVERSGTSQVVIPAFLYQTKPAVPDVPLPTLGARLLLVAHERVSDEAVEEMLGAAFESRFTHLMHPPLDIATLAAAPRAELHAGTDAFLARRDPAITHELFDELSNSLSILGALFGAGAFMVQGWRQRRRAQRDEIIASQLMRVAALERRIVEIELSAEMDLDTLMAVQRELLQLKSDALAAFTSGELGDQATLSSILDPVNAARDHVGELLLHVRQNLERAAAVAWDTAEKAEETAAPTE
jgi:TRAP-type uncharacterized transport system substrate-binding protein